MYKRNQYQKRSIRLKEYDYTNSGYYYVTICTDDKICCFGKIEKEKMVLNNYGKILDECWNIIPKHFKHTTLDYYVIMPNHLHGIIIIEGRDKACLVPTSERKFGKPISGSLPTIVGSFKSAVTKQINESRQNISKSVWQSNYYEHIIRNEKDLFFTRRYIELNPLKWELDEYYSNKTS